MVSYVRMILTIHCLPSKFIHGTWGHPIVKLNIVKLNKIIKQTVKHCEINQEQKYHASGTDYEYFPILTK